MDAARRQEAITALSENLFDRISKEDDSQSLAFDRTGEGGDPFRLGFDDDDADCPPWYVEDEEGEAIAEGVSALEAVKDMHDKGY